MQEQIASPLLLAITAELVDELNGSLAQYCF
jgi:hypothetical protein